MTKAKFFQRESLFKPKCVEHEVNNNTLRFYPLSVNMLWKMRTAVEPIAQALRVVSGGKNDYEKTVDQDFDSETGDRRVVTHMGAVKPEIARLREDRLDEAIKNAMNSFFDAQFRTFVGEMIADSLREDFTRDEARDPKVIKEMMEGDGDGPGLDVATLGEMVAGLVKANARVFGPFGLRVREMLAERMGDILNDVSGHGIKATSDSQDSIKSENADELESSQNSPDPALSQISAD